MQEKPALGSTHSYENSAKHSQAGVCIWKKWLKLTFYYLLLSCGVIIKSASSWGSLWSCSASCPPGGACGAWWGGHIWRNQKKKYKGGYQAPPGGHWFILWCKHLSCFVLAALWLLHLKTKASFATPPGAKPLKGSEYSTRDRTAISYRRLTQMPSGWKNRDSSQRRVGCGHQSLTPHTHQINDPDKQAPWNIGTGRWHKAPQKVPGQADGGYTAGNASESALMGGKVVDEFQWGEVSGNEIRQKGSTRGRQMDSGYWLQPEKAVWQYQAGVLEMIYYVP